jgi:hypothetical protein
VGVDEEARLLAAVAERAEGEVAVPAATAVPVALPAATAAAAVAARRRARARASTGRHRRVTRVGWGIWMRGREDLRFWGRREDPRGKRGAFSSDRWRGYVYV